MSQSGRPLSGFTRPGTQGGRPGTMEQAIRTPRTAHTARPVTSASGRYVRLGTVSLLLLLYADNLLIIVRYDKY
jgi:tetratricopeptide repeat protein 8